MSLNKVIEWFAEHKKSFPDVVFNPPASQEELNRLSMKFDQLPDEIFDIYKMANGQDVYESFVFNAMSIYSIEEMITQYDDLYPGEDEIDELTTKHSFLVEDDDGPVKAVYWDVGWVPFMGSPDEPVFYYDLSPAKGGKAGQIIYAIKDQNKVVAHSVTDFFDRLWQGLSSGQYHHNGMGGLSLDYSVFYNREQSTMFE